MSIDQPGAPAAADQPGAAGAPTHQMQATEPRRPRTPAAFGTGSGAAIVFRDLASI